VPEHECYGVCANAWGGYIEGSLRDLIETGTGRPNPREEDDLPDHQSSATKVRAGMSTPRPGSILLGSANPAQLRDWYRKALAPDHVGEGPIVLGDFLLIIDQRDDVAAKNHEPGRMILNFHVSDFDAVEAQLRAAGVNWLTPVEDRPGGRFGTFVDPDGNYLQIIQLKDEVGVHA
jgi:catechol 2,3-dioxygenase-like lactoylglutathione lyase family enzyme